MTDLVWAWASLGLLVVQEASEWPFQAFRQSLDQQSKFYVKVATE